jgi:DNA-binding ferritin-like protein
MSKILTSFLTFQQQIRIYHWSTKRYSHHIASGELYEKVDDLIDRFIETLQGKIGRIAYKKLSISLRALNEKTVIKTMNVFKLFLVRDVERYLDNNNMTNTDLINIRDEILGLINQALYLFSFQ